MLLMILTRTPVFIWVLLAGLVALGLQQSRDRQIGLARATVVPLVLFALSLAGVLGAFGTRPAPLLAWLAGVALAGLTARRAVASTGATWSATRRLLHVPGSFLPLVLILCLFLTKYAAGVSLAMHPSFATDHTFGSGFGFAYGVFAGLFVVRAAGLWQLTRPAVARSAVPFHAIDADAGELG